MALSCPAHCARWARKYLGYCLCSSKDAFSLALGMLSVMSWGVAEIPQIITNYKTKSTDGLSFAFLFTWIIGDLFNLFGCLLEPATLPTQYYMALLYTAITLILAFQSVYYGHIYHQLKSKRHCHETPEKHIQHGSNEEERLASGNDRQGYGSSVHGSRTSPSSPIPLPAIPRSYSDGRESYYMSARSLSKSQTPTMRSFLAQRRAAIIDDEGGVEQPLLGGSLPTKSTSTLSTKSMLCVVSVGTFLCGILNTARMESRHQNMVFKVPNKGMVKLLKRKLLQVNGEHLINTRDDVHGKLGTLLGWAMAAIYMGGRLPQICLNIRRGNMEGLNPFMFLFALIGNATYVGSILVNSLEWSRILPNLPWLVDAGGCVLLDTFILTQFIYFHHWESKCLTNKYGDNPA
ncbi:hypothetical protein Ancab_015931 [Ancistrocladus abbreviatus]